MSTSQFERVRDYRHALRDLNGQLTGMLSAASHSGVSEDARTALYSAARNVAESEETGTCRHSHPSQRVQVANFNKMEAHYAEALQHLSLAQSTVEDGSRAADLMVLANGLLSEARVLAEQGMKFAETRDAAAHAKAADSENTEQEQSEAIPDGPPYGF